jgi:hypothetical protein
MPFSKVFDYFTDLAHFKMLSSVTYIHIFKTFKSFDTHVRAFHLFRQFYLKNYLGTKVIFWNEISFSEVRRIGSSHF